MNVNIPKKLKELFNRVDNPQKLSNMLLGMQALLNKMAISQDAHLLNKAILNRGKKWKLEVLATTFGAEVEISGFVSFKNSIYNPIFDVEVKVFKKKFFKPYYVGKIKAKGTFNDMANNPNENIIVLEQKDAKTNELTLKKLGVFSLLPILIDAIFKPVAIELLQQKQVEK